MPSARLPYVWLLVLSCSIAAQPSATAQEDERTQTSANFSITWTSDQGSIDAPDPLDADGDGVPDGVEAMLDAFEAARAFLLNNLGYRSPPVEGVYQLYVAQSQGVGFTRPAPGGTGRSRASLIVIPPRLVAAATSAMEMQTFAVHEYFHAIQLGYDAEENHWIREASSTWVQEIFLDDFDTNHHLLREFVPNPRLPLDSVGYQHEYGAFLFLQFLTERYGGGSLTGAALIKELWEEMAVPEAVPGAPDRTSLGAIATLLERRGVSPGAAWGEFLLWRWRLGHFEEGPAYRGALDGLEWPHLFRSSVISGESCRLTLDGPGGGLPPWSGDFVRLTPEPFGARTASATLAVQGPPGSGGFILLKRRGVPKEEQLLAFDSTGLAIIDVPFGRSQIRHLTLGTGYVAVPEIGIPPASVAYSLRLSGRSAVEATPPEGPERTVFGTGVGLSGAVSCAGEPAPLADIEITETQIVSGATRIFRVETDITGRWSLGVTPEAHSLYTARVVDPLLSQPAPAPGHRLDVEVFVSLMAEAERIPAGTPIRLLGQVSPSHPGAPMRIEFRRPERNWRPGPEVLVDSTGAYQAELLLPRGGHWEVRARVLSTRDADHLPGTSSPILVEVGRV